MPFMAHFKQVRELDSKSKVLWKQTNPTSTHVDVRKDQRYGWEQYQIGSQRYENRIFPEQENTKSIRKTERIREIRRIQSNWYTIMQGHPLEAFDELHLSPKILHSIRAIFRSTKERLIATNSTGPSSDIMVPNIPSDSEVPPATNISSTFTKVTLSARSSWNLCSYLT